MPDGRIIAKTYSSISSVPVHEKVTLPSDEISAPLLGLNKVIQIKSFGVLVGFAIGTFSIGVWVILAVGLFVTSFWVIMGVCIVNGNWAGDSLVLISCADIPGAQEAREIKKIARNENNVFMILYCYTNGLTVCIDLRWGRDGEAVQLEK